MSEERKIKTERWKLLARLEKLLDGPMVFLGFAWLVLLIIELTQGLSPALQKVSVFIWIIFIIYFIIAFILAPEKWRFLKKNILTVISLVVPAFRIFRIVRIFRVLRSVRLVKVLTSVNRSMRSLAAAMSRRAFGYMLLLSVIVILAGSAGMYAFEHEVNAGLNTYRESLWWTAMVVLTVGTEYWPKTTEGRILCYILAIYGFAVLGYLTAALATFFIGRDTEKKTRQLAPEDVAALKQEITELKSLIQTLKQKNIS